MPSTQRSRRAADASRDTLWQGNCDVRSLYSTLGDDRYVRSNSALRHITFSIDTQQALALPNQGGFLQTISIRSGRVSIIWPLPSRSCAGVTPDRVIALLTGYIVTMHFGGRVLYVDDVSAVANFYRRAFGSQASRYGRPCVAPAIRLKDSISSAVILRNCGRSRSVTRSRPISSMSSAKIEAVHRPGK